MRITVFALIALLLTGCGHLGIEPDNSREFWDRISEQAGG